jgi:ATP-binding cassette subfamily C (CFTR/MRP) protein 1
MMFLPRALSAIADARNALTRLSIVFRAETRTGEAFIIDTEQELAIRVDDASWAWESFPDAEKEGTKKKSKAGKEEDEKGKRKDEEDEEDALPFEVRNISMAVPRGTLAAVVGRVGSGKSSLLQGLIGEMRLVEGSFAFGGRVAYCPQSAWIQNATLVRE